MKKLLLLSLASLCAATAFAASADKSPSAKPDKDTAALVKDEQADNAQGKKAVKKASPKAKQSARDEANRTKSQVNTGEQKSGGSAK